MIMEDAAAHLPGNESMTPQHDRGHSEPVLSRGGWRERALEAGSRSKRHGIAQSHRHIHCTVAHSLHRRCKVLCVHLFNLSLLKHPLMVIFGWGHASVISAWLTCSMKEIEKTKIEFSFGVAQRQLWLIPSAGSLLTEDSHVVLGYYF